MAVLVQDGIGPDVLGAAADLLAAISPEIKSPWSASLPRDWANESFAITEAVRTGCCVLHGPSCNPAAANITIGAEYLDANEPVVKEQLQKAGVRLARRLDTALAN